MEPEAENRLSILPHSDDKSLYFALCSDLKNSLLFQTDNLGQDA